MLNYLGFMPGVCYDYGRLMGMEINVLIDDGFEGCPEADWLRGIAEQALVVQDAGSDAELGLVIIGQEKVRQLNRSYRGQDEPTDVLAFAGREEAEGEFPPFIAPPDGVTHLGEVVISYPQAVAQAGEQQHSVKRELAILIIHGVLHLLGFDHDKPELEREMKAREAEILGRVEGGLD